jgi:antitoxin CptB
MANQNNKDELIKLRKQLTFRSWHRGTKEMDLLMGSFADQNLSSFSLSQLKAYEQILSMSDPDLYNWITQREQVPANFMCDVMQMILDHKYVK